MNRVTDKRIADEKVAIEEALESLAAETKTEQYVRSLRERLELAKSINAKGQVQLIEKEITKTERAFKIEHRNPYPEVTKDDARNSMCEPTALEPFQSKALQSALEDVEKLLAQEGIKTGAQLKRHVDLFGDEHLRREYDYVALDVFGSRRERQTHKYDLACEVLTVGEPQNFVTYEGRHDTEVMLPMAALCRLKEAADKNMFDAYEVWRPSEWKAPDPWLVGVQVIQNRNEDTKRRYFKVCDWR